MLAAMADRPFVLPLLAALAGRQQRRAGAMRELPRIAHEVCVDVRLGDMRDAQALVRCRREVLRDIAIRIDHDGLTGALASDQEAACAIDLS